MIVIRDNNVEVENVLVLVVINLRVITPERWVHILKIVIAVNNGDSVGQIVTKMHGQEMKIYMDVVGMIHQHLVVVLVVFVLWNFIQGQVAFPVVIHITGGIDYPMVQDWRDRR